MFGAAEQKQATSSLAYPDPFTFELFGSFPSISGVVVTPETAMRCTPVRAAVQAIAEALGQLPVHVYDRDPATGVRSRDKASPVAALLNGAANEWTPGPKLREQLTRDALLWPQGGFAFINRLSSGRVVEITRLHPADVSIGYNQATGEPSYSVDGRPLDRADVLHIHGPVVGLLPESPTMQAKEAIGLALVLEQHAARLFAKGARPSGLISFPNTLAPEAALTAKAAWKAAHSGQNSGDTAVLDNGATWQALTFNSVDAEFLAQRKLAIEEIARAFRVPPVLLMEYGRATWGNSEEMGRQFVTYCLLPWIKQWEGEIGLKLIDPADRATTYAEFDVDALLRADFVQRATAYTAAVAARWMNPNEVRERENLPPYAAGDAFLNPNTTTETVTV